LKGQAFGSSSSFEGRAFTPVARSSFERAGLQARRKQHTKHSGLQPRVKDYAFHGYEVPQSSISDYQD
jgi:hypothetical protein